MYYSRLKGFTLIELLIVVAIIAILAAIAVPNFLEAQTRAKVARVKADIRSMATALESYYVDNNNYVPAAYVGAGTPFWPGQGGPYHPTGKWTKDDGVTELGGFFHMLSTPIAYIGNSFIRDPFSEFVPTENQSWWKLPQPSGNHIQYTAANPDSMVLWRGASQGSGSRGDPVTDGTCPYASRNPQIQWWTLWSVGPDRDPGAFVQYEMLSRTESKDVTDYFTIGDLGVARCYDNYPSTDYRNKLYRSVIDTVVSGTRKEWRWNRPTANSIASQFVYDSTNGSLSGGNIYRTGGVPLEEIDVGWYNDGSGWAQSKARINPYTYGSHFWIFTQAFSLNIDD